MRKIAVKILTILLVVSAAILVLSGCASLDVQLDRDGSGTATLTLSKEEGVTKESIESELNEIFEGAAKLSQGRDVLKLKSVKESADGFSVKISFRRIRYIEGIGQYNFMSFSDFIKEMNKTSLVSNWEKGKYKNIQNYNEFIYNFNNQADESRAFSPVTADGEKLTAKEFTAQDSPYAANDKGMIFTYYIVGFSNLESVTFRFNGKIGVVGGKNVELVGDNAVKVTPVQSVVNVTEIREGEDPVGVERSVDCFTGYVYFVESANLTLILCLSGAGLLLAALIAVGIWRGWFKKIWRGARCRFIRKNYGLYLMMLPALVMLIIFSYAPMTGIVLAFKDFSIDDGIFGSEWAGMLGFKNFYDVLTTPGHEFRYAGAKHGDPGGAEIHIRISLRYPAGDLIQLSQKQLVQKVGADHLVFPVLFVVGSGFGHRLSLPRGGRRYFKSTHRAVRRRCRCSGTVNRSTGGRSSPLLLSGRR